MGKPVSAAASVADKESLWRDRFARHAASKQSIEAFCRSESVSSALFYHWRKRLGIQAINPVSAPSSPSANFIDLGAGLTPHFEFDDDHVARLYNKASLYGVDVFFEKVRRRIQLLERPISSSGNAGRTWNGYAAYNPSMVVKFLEIFRVVHNYVDVRSDKGTKTTPAMRLGLAKAPNTYGDILYFSTR